MDNAVIGWDHRRVDGKNTFNLVNRVAVLWNTRVVWPRCSQFLFNTNREFAALVLRETTEFVLSREVVTQGEHFI